MDVVFLAFGKTKSVKERKNDSVFDYFRFSLDVMMRQIRTINLVQH